MRRLEDFNRMLVTLFTDEQAHIIHEKLWGGVDPYGHNKNPDGSPAGDCYKCRIIRDEVHAVIRKYETFEPRPPQSGGVE
jgi:hypothetical protein